MPLFRYIVFCTSSISRPRSIAAPIGVSPLLTNWGGDHSPTSTNSVIVSTGPNVMTAIWTRRDASGSALSSSFNKVNPAFNSSIGLPCIEPDTSNNRTQGHRWLGLMMKGPGSKGFCSKMSLTTILLSFEGSQEDRGRTIHPL